MHRLLETVSTTAKYTVTICVAFSVTSALFLTEKYLTDTNEFKQEKKGDIKCLCTTLKATKIENVQTIYIITVNNLPYKIINNVIIILKRMASSDTRFSV